jgi:hypothetical protein
MAVAACAFKYAPISGKLTGPKTPVTDSLVTGVLEGELGATSMPTLPAAATVPPVTVNSPLTPRAPLPGFVGPVISTVQSPTVSPPPMPPPIPPWADAEVEAPPEAFTPSSFAVTLGVPPLMDPAAAFVLLDVRLEAVVACGDPGRHRQWPSR